MSACRERRPLRLSIRRLLRCPTLMLCAGLVLLAVACLAAPATAFADEPTWTVQSSPTTATLFGVSAVGPYEAFAVGGGGVVLHTEDGGAEWSPLASGTTNTLFGCHFIDSETGWAVGAGGTILVTTDGGANWTAQTSGTASNLRGVFFLDANNGWAVGNAGTIRKTTDGGTTWSAVSSPATPTLQDAYFQDANTGYVGGNAGTLMKTTDGGSTWTTMAVGTAAINSIDFYDANIGCAATSAGYNLVTTDGFSSWGWLPAGTYANYGIDFAGTSEWVFSVGTTGTACVSNDRGANWSAQYVPTVQSLRSVSMYDENTGWSVGTGGEILRWATPDDTPPVTTDDHVAVYTGSATILLTPTDAGSGVAHTYYSLDSASFVEGTAIYTTVGSHTLSYYSVDNNGNAESPVTISFLVNATDITAPVTTHTLSGTAGNAGWWRSAVTVTLAAADEPGGSGLASTYYRRGGQTPSLYGAPFSAGGGGDGPRAFSYWSFDAAGNKEDTRTITISFDRIDPVTTDDHVSSYLLQATVQLSVVDTASGCDRVYYSLDSAPFTEGATVTAGIGTHTLSYYSVDVAGNTESVKGPVTFDVVGGSLNYQMQFGSPGTGDGEFDALVYGMAFTQCGRQVFVADTLNNRIQVFSAAGVYLDQWTVRDPGTGTAVQPWGVATGPDDSVYVTTRGAPYKVLRYTPGGGLLDHWGGYGTGASQFEVPGGIAVGRNGHVFVTDDGSRRVQEFSPTGAFVRSATFGSGPIVSGDVSFVTVAPDDHVYVSDQELNAIDVFDSALAPVTTIAGAGRFSSPAGMAFASDGTFYVASSGDYRIVQLDSTGTVLGSFGSQGTANGQFDKPAALAWGNGGLFVAERAPNCRVQQFCTSTAARLSGLPMNYQLKWGSTGNGDSEFWAVSGMAVDPASGNVYVADGNHSIQVFSPSGDFLFRWNVLHPIAGCDWPAHGIAIGEGGIVYVATGYSYINMYRLNGEYLGYFGGPGSGDGDIGDTDSIAYGNNRLYVADSANRRVTEYAPDGSFSRWWPYGTGSIVTGDISHVAVAPTGRIYVSQKLSNMIEFAEPDGSIVGTIDGNPRFTAPGGMAFAEDGSFYLAEYGTMRVEHFTATGELIDFWGDTPGTTDGNFLDPGEVAFGNGGLYVGEGSSGCRVQMFCRGGLPPEDCVTIQDPDIQAAVRAAISKPTGAITRSDMAPMTALTCNTGLGSLEGLQHAVNLQTLDISNTSASDLSPLSGLSALYSILANDTAVEDLGPIAGNKRLTGLGLTNTPVTDLQPLSGLTGMTYLWLNNTGVSSLAPLGYMPALREVYARNTDITDISALSGHSNLFRLEIGDTAVSDLSPLSGLTTLAQLFFDTTHVTSLSALSTCPNLTTISANNDGITDLTPIGGLSNLRVLGLYNNSVSDISVLSPMTSLVMVDVSGNFLDVSPSSPDYAVIQTLLTRGTTVFYSPQNGDWSAPTTSISYSTPAGASGWWTSAPDVTLTATDGVGGSGVASTFYRLGSDPTTHTYGPGFTISAEGTTSVEYWSVDAFGNEEPHHTVDVKVDTAAPVTSLGGLPASSVASAAVSLSLGSLDAASGVPGGAIKYVLDSVQPTATYAAPVAVSGPGPHTIVFWASDAAGNEEARQTRTFTITRYEQTDPHILFTGSWESWIGSGFSGGNFKRTRTVGSAVNIAFTGTSVDYLTLLGPNCGVATVYLDGVAAGTADLYSSTYRYQRSAFSRTGLAPGAHTLRFECTGSRNPSATDSYIGIDAVVAPGGLTAAVEPYTTYEQEDSRIYYSSPWELWSSPSMSGGNFRRTRTTGRSAVIAFNGTAIEWTGVSGPIYGKAHLVIDGSIETTVDLYTPAYRSRALLWRLTGLAPGAHTVRIDWTGQRNPAATDTYVGIDTVRVLGTLSPAAAPFTTVEETATVLAYTGSWERWYSGGFSSGQFKRTNSAIGAVETTFTGTGVDWITLTGPVYGIARVRVDGVSVGTVDLYTPTYRNQQMVWSASGLTPGEHRVRIEYTGTGNAAATGTWVGLDALRVWGP